MGVDTETLQAMTRQIVRETNPRRVLLFGSHARGDANSESDVDLLVVCDGPFSSANPRRAVAGNLYQKLRGHAVAKDIVVCTQVEFDRLRNDKNHLYSHAAREGQVLYERQ